MADATSEQSAHARTRACNISQHHSGYRQVGLTISACAAALKENSGTRRLRYGSEECGKPNTRQCL